MWPAPPWMIRRGVVVVGEGGGDMVDRWEERRRGGREVGRVSG